VSQRPRVPGSIAEIDGSPSGPHVGAFFDFDGTLIAGYSASVLAQDRLRRREIGLAEVGRTIRTGLQAGMGRADFSDFMKLTAEGWRGRSDDEMEEMGERLFIQKIADRVYPEAREIVAAHQRRGHTVALTSSATRYQVSAIARDLGIDHVLCTELEVADGILTGNLAGPPLWAEGKAEAVQKFAADCGIDLGESYFYADGNEDVALMHLVGKPRPTNPGRRLEQVARRRAWPIQRFASRGRVTPELRARNAAAMASLAPIALASAAIGVVRGDRRAAVNLIAERWLATAFAITGVKLNVVGLEHLSAQRPAVFVFNHRTNIDPFIAASLVGNDFTLVATEGMANIPLFGAIGRMAGVTFDDKGLEETVRTERVSVLASPEGTRIAGERVGPFETAPFRVALAAQIPVVPIVIRNAELLGARNSGIVRPGTVEVAILPPISVAGWTVDGLAKHAQAVRQRFVDTLATWPTS
jgi:putative phosphoserine phosphatase/1-acylglycerol-3-phosphate O-acyltransferase